MLESVSPYELLKASRPRQTPTFATAYDLYSAASTQENLPRAQAASAEAAAPAPQPSDPAPKPCPTAAPPVRRTHYIADIKTRHNAAMRSAPQMHHPLV